MNGRTPYDAEWLEYDDDTRPVHSRRDTVTRKPIIYTADAARIDEHQDGRIAIIVDTDEGDKLYVDIHDIALAFYASVQANLRPYALEAESARASLPPTIYTDAYDEAHGDSGYALDDPKHPTYHDRMVD